MDERENCKRCCALATSRVVATADVLITSEHQPPRFSGCLQCARIDCQNRHRRSGRHEEHQAFEAGIMDYDDARASPITFSSEQANAGPWDTGSSYVDQSGSTDDRADSAELHHVDAGDLSWHLNDGEFERLGRYEAALCRQIVQTLFALRSSRFQVHTDCGSTVLKARRLRPGIFGPHIQKFRCMGSKALLRT
jgi:hypothetical protein